MSDFTPAVRALDRAIGGIEENIEDSRRFVDSALSDVRAAQKVLEKAEAEHSRKADQLAAYRTELAELRAARRVLTEAGS